MNNNILWLPSWYPGKLDAFTGDFIQRHAIALSAFASVHVLYIVRDIKKLVTESIKTEEHHYGNLSETIIYYYSPFHPVKTLDKYFSIRKYNSIYKKYLKDLFKKKGLPAAVHVHVPYKAGLIALWIKKKYGIDYYVTEHWAGYDKANPDNFFSRPWSFRHIVRKILGNSTCVVPVNKDLDKKLKSIEPSIKTKIIPNTVDSSLFYLVQSNSPVIRFVHYVSSYKDQKNTEGILKVFSKLQEKRDDWECVMYGPADARLVKLVEQYSLQQKIRFTGEISYSKVAELVRAASIFVSFSNYENQPCSILEALCCGLPVIATATGGIPEIINSQNGILVEPKNEIQLLHAIETMMNTLKEYDRNKIAEDAGKKFSYPEVGKQLLTLYKEEPIE